MDFWVGTLCIFLLATFQTILFGWGLGIDKGMEEINRGASIPVPRLVGYVLKYVAPIYLITIFVVWLYQQITAEKGNYFKALANERVAQYSVGFILIVAVLFMLFIAQSVKRWEKLEKQQQEAKR
jgi:hypothetical protein